ncbi:MAG TPA: hypothetical protein VGR91_17135 [Stellaceae bacterium]|nr:hypothetical protein [Stellaceae bacterium]
MTKRSKNGSDVAWSPLGDTLRANPVPLALIGFGLAWLLARNTGVIDNLADDERLRAASRRIGETIGIKADEGPAAGKREAERWVHQAAGAARGALATVRGSAAVERAEQLAGEAGERASQIGDRLADAMERHPLLVGALGLVSGAALASLLPPGKSSG